MQQWKPKENQLYSMYKLHEDGRRELKGIGEMWMSVVEVGKGVAFCNWFTTQVDFIEKTGKGIIFETLNSTYLIEECDKLPGFLD